MITVFPINANIIAIRAMRSLFNRLSVKLYDKSSETNRLTTSPSSMTTSLLDISIHLASVDFPLLLSPQMQIIFPSSLWNSSIFY